MDSGDELPNDEMDFSGDEEKTDERKHNQLLDAISSLDGKKKHRLSQRTVFTNQISEFNFASSKDVGSKVRLHELVGTLKDSTSHGDLKKQLSSIDKKKQVVSVPLPKHEKQKIDRSVAYETTTTDLSKWDSVVRTNRQADQLQFPLQKQDFKLVTTDQFVKRFQPRTPLEMQVAALLRGSDNVIKGPQQELTPAEQRALQAMDIDEAKQRRLELMKHRALLSYKETKAKWQSKIKSKKFHRILKKDRQKKENKVLEEMKKTDPEEYLEQIKLMEKGRAEERVSLKHRGASKFGKRQMIYAKYDDKARQEVQDMLQKSRELTKKLDVDSDSDDDASEGGVSMNSEDEMNMIDSDLQSGKVANPWMAKPSLKVQSSFSDVAVDEKSKEDDGDELEILESENDTNTMKSNNIEEFTEVKNKKNNENSKSQTEHDLDAIDVIFDGAKTAVDVSSSNKKGKKKKKHNKNKQVTSTEANVQSNNASTKANVQSNNTSTEANIQSNNKKAKRNKRKKKANKNENVAEKDEPSDNEDEELISEGLIRKRTIEDLDHGFAENTSPKKAKLREKESKKNKKNEETPVEAYVDPNKLFTMDTKMRQVGAGPDIIDDDEEDMDPEEQQRMTIAQAFADDDVIEEFSKEKGEAIDKNQPKDIDLSLPGWGSWGGDGIVLSKRKRKRFIIKAPPAAPRKDMHLGHVILNEEKISALKKHQVSEVPFPFKSPNQFEESIRAPIGKTWNTETAYKQLVKPKVVTRTGQIINPMEKSAVFKDQKPQTTNPKKPDMAFGKKSDKNEKHVNSKMKRIEQFKKSDKNKGQGMSGKTKKSKR